MRALLTCRPLAGHYRPMLPLARALAEAGHDVAFASGEPVAGEAEAEGFTAFRVGLAPDSVEPLARRVRDLAASLPPSQVRSFVFTELFVRVELEPRANDLFKIVEQWAPHVVVHDVAEFAAPLVATMVGIPYVEHSYGPAIQNDVIRAAGDATAPFWSSHGLAPHPLGGLYRYLYLDVCPPSLQVPEAVTGAVQGIRTVETQPPATQPPVAGCAARPADRLHHARHRLQPEPRRVPGAARRPPRRSAEPCRHGRQAKRPRGCSDCNRRTSTCTSTSRKSCCSLTAPLS